MSWKMKEELQSAATKLNIGYLELEVKNFSPDLSLIHQQVLKQDL